MRDPVGNEFKELLKGSSLLEDSTFSRYLGLGFVFAPDALDQFAEHYEQDTPDPGAMEVDEGEVSADLEDNLLAAVASVVRSSGCTEARLGLTGGLDSRTVFAALRHIIPEENIHCFTFGFPGQFDFEFFRHYSGIAKNHLVLETRQIEWSIEREVAAAARASGPRTYSSKDYLGRMLDAAGVPKLNFHGFMGDAALGGSKPDAYTPIVDWQDAKLRFLKKNDRWRLQFLFGQDDLNALLPDAPETVPPGLDYFDVLDFGLRQRQRIGKNLLSSKTTLTPLADNRWMRAQLAEPNPERRERRYMRFLATFAPDVFPELQAEGIETRKEHLAFRKRFLQAAYDAYEPRDRNTAQGRSTSLPLTTQSGTVLAGRQFCERAEYDNNPSFNAFARDLFFGFRDRGILPARLLNGIWDGFIARRLIDTERMRGLINIEINIRAQKFGSDGVAARASPREDGGPDVSVFAGPAPPAA